MKLAPDTNYIKCLWNLRFHFKGTKVKVTRVGRIFCCVCPLQIHGDPSKQQCHNEEKVVSFENASSYKLLTWSSKPMAFTDTPSRQSK